MQPGENIGFLLQRLAFHIERESDQVLQEQLGVGYSQFKLLMVLRWRGNIQQKQIAATLGQTEASISRQVKLMEEKGLLTFSVNPKNKREHITKLTPKGIRTVEKSLEILNNYHTPMFNMLSDKQKTELIGILELMHSYINPPEIPEQWAD